MFLVLLLYFFIFLQFLSFFFVYILSFLLECRAIFHDLLLYCYGFFLVQICGDYLIIRNTKLHLGGWWGFCLIRLYQFLQYWKEFYLSLRAVYLNIPMFDASSYNVHRLFEHLNFNQDGNVKYCRMLFFGTWPNGKTHCPLSREGVEV